MFYLNDIKILLNQNHFLSFSSGIGYASHLIIAFSATSYIIILAWAFFYLFSSFSSDLPWASCGNYWNSGSSCDAAYIQIKAWNTVKPILYFKKYKASCSFMCKISILVCFYVFTLDSCFDNRLNLSLESRLNTTLPVVEFWQ